MKRQHSKHIFSTMTPAGCYDVENTATGEKFRECDVKKVAEYIRAQSKSSEHYAVGTAVHDVIAKVGEALGKAPESCLPCAEREAFLNSLLPKR